MEAANSIISCTVLWNKSGRRRVLTAPSPTGSLVSELLQDLVRATVRAKHLRTYRSAQNHEFVDHRRSTKKAVKQRRRHVLAETTAKTTVPHSKVKYELGRPINERRSVLAIGIIITQVKCSARLHARWVSGDFSETPGVVGRKFDKQAWIGYSLHQVRHEVSGPTGTDDNTWTLIYCTAAQAGRTTVSLIHEVRDLHLESRRLLVLLDNRLGAR